MSERSVLEATREGLGLQNWAGNHTYRAEALLSPATLEELAETLRRTESVRAIATRHTFTDIGDARTLIAFDRLAEADRIEVDARAMTVTVGPAVTYAQLAGKLNRHGLALPNLASLPHISVCGAVATATHGSGDGLGNLATSVRGLRLLSSDGELVSLTGQDDRLTGAAVHLGLLGLVVELTLSVVPYYEVCQYVYPGVGWELLLDRFDEVLALGRSVSIFHTLGRQAPAVWVKRDAGTGPPAGLLGVEPAQTPQHPLAGGDPDSATEQLGLPGAWSERMPHFRSGFTPSSGSEIQSEVFVERAQAPEAIRTLLGCGPHLAAMLLGAEIRSVAADELWMSPQYGRDSVGLHFTWRREPQAVLQNVAEIERVLLRFAPRPHWGKVSAMPPALIADAYPRSSAFRELRAQLDPRGVFVNRWARQRVPFLLDDPTG